MPRPRAQSRFSEFVKQLVLNESWRILLNDRELCNRLANHCCLCNQWCSAAKGIVAHLRREHRESFAASLALRAPIRRILRIGAHCEACGVAVKNEHTCPVTTQLAVLAHHHGGQAPMIDLASPRPSSETTPDAGKRKSPFDGPYVEEPAGPKLDARRDCRGGHNICNHCGQSYSDHIGLKRHIENGKCPRFDAELAPQTWILAYRAPVIEMFHLMQPESWLQERDLLQRMRNECVLCGRRFVNGQGLNMHLAQEHLADVHKADSWAKHLQDYYQPHGAACLCGSWHSFNNAQHVCPVATQIGILRNVAKANLAPPGTGTVPRLLDSWIMEEDFEKAWRHPDYSYVFGQYCSLCLNRTPSLEALWLHFEEFHASMLPEALVMYDRLLQDFPNCCSACSVMPREAFSQAPKCPFAVNSILLHNIRHGLAHGRDGRRGAHGTPRRVRASHRSRLSHPGETQETRRQNQEATSVSDTQGGTGRGLHGGSVSQDVPPTTPPKRYAQCTLHGEQLGDLHGQTATGSSPSCATGHENLVCRTPPRASDPTAESLHLSSHVPGNEGQNGENPAGTERGPNMARSSTRASSHRSRECILSAMEPGDEDSGSVITAGHTPDGSPGLSGAIEKLLFTGRGSPEIPCDAEHQPANRWSATMEDAAECEKGDHHDKHHGPPTGISSLAVPSMQSQSVDPTEIQLGAAASPSFAGGLLREAIQTSILGLRLINEGNRCWGNATVHSWLWTTTCIKDVQWQDFGMYQSQVGALLASNQAKGVNLSSLGFTPQVLQRATQEDSSEYASILMSPVRSECFQQGWETRIMVGENCDVLQSVTSHEPLILRKSVEGPQDLQELIDSWCATDNAVTAFTNDSLCKCLQIDRMYHGDRGQPCKTITPLRVGNQVLLPHFVVETTYELVPYKVSAIVYHKGQSGAGHFQSGLKCSDDFWMRTDDGRVACPMQNFPHSMAGHIVQVWMVRQDRYLVSELMAPPMDFGRQVMAIRQKMANGQHRELRQMVPYMRLLQSQCVLCGGWVFRMAAHLAHLQDHHPEVRLPWRQYGEMLKSLEHTPCRWCRAWNVEEHDCMVLWQACVAENAEPEQLNGGVVTLERLREEAAQKTAKKNDNPTTAAEEPEEAPLPLTETLAALATPLVTRSGGEDQFWVYMERPDGIFGMESTGSSASDIAGSDPSDSC